VAEDDFLDNDTPMTATKMRKRLERVAEMERQNPPPQFVTDFQNDLIEQARKHGLIPDDAGAEKGKG
jgi:septum formation topological specificity factor MinE